MLGRRTTRRPGAGGDHELARALLEESLSAWRELGDRVGVGRGLRNLGRVAIATGELARARALLGQSLTIFRECGVVRIIPLALEGFAGLAAARGRPARSLRLAGAAAALRAATGERVYRGEEAELDRWLAPARAALSPEEVDAARAAGQAMGLEAAVVDALADEAT